MPIINDDDKPFHDSLDNFAHGFLKALGTFLDDQDTTSLIPFTRSFLADIVGLIGDEPLTALVDQIDQVFQRASLRRWDRSAVIGEVADKNAIKSATAYAEFVAQAMKNGLSEDAAMRLLDRASLHLWRIETLIEDGHVVERVSPADSESIGDVLSKALEPIQNLVGRYVAAKAANEMPAPTPVSAPNGHARRTRPSRARD